MATLPRMSPAEPSVVLDEPDAEEFEGLHESFDAHVWSESMTLELEAPELAGVPFS